jgi:hypothetical protein
VNFITLADDIVEQDLSGRIFVNERLRHVGLLVACCDALAGPQAAPCAGKPAAFLCMHRDATQTQLAVFVIGPVLWIFAPLVQLSAVPLLDGWSVIAREQWRDQIR